MKIFNQKIFTLILVLAHSAQGVSASAAASGGKVPGIRLTGSETLYSFSDGKVFKGGQPVPDPGAAGEAERVKRVALFYLWLARDPFFLSPGADLADLGSGVLRLADAERKVLGSVMDKGEKVYPLGFLAAYAGASSAFDLFASSPSEKGASEVLQSIEQGVEAYSSEAESISASVDKYFDSMKVDTLAGLGGGNVTDRKTVRGDFALIRKNSLAAAKHLAELKKCLLSSSAYCRPAWPDARPVWPGAASLSRTELVDFSVYGLKKAETSGPYLVAGSCWGTGKESYFYYQERCQDGGFCMEWSSSATEMLFRALIPDAPGNKELVEKGAKLEMRSSASTYACADKEYMMNTAALAKFTEKYGDRSVFSGVDTAGMPAGVLAAIEAARKAEQDFSAEDIKSQGGLEKLGNDYLAVAKAVDDLDLPFKGELLERLRIITLKTSGFGLAINRVAFHLAKFSNNFKGLPETFSRRLYGIGTTFLSRNHYSLMFMPFSPTVWRIPDKLVYRTGALPEEQRHFMDYKRAVRLYGRSEVDNAIQRASVELGKTYKFKQRRGPK